MNTLDAIQKRWGCRKFSDEPIDKEQLGTILDAGRYAPSAGNLQDRSFIIIKDSDLKKEIALAAGNQTWMQTAPVYVVIVAENRKLGKFFGPKGDKVYSIQDTAFAVENMLLAATDLEIGCSLVVGFNEEKLTDLLKIEPPAQPHAIVVLGKSLEEAKQTSRYPLERFIFFEKYGNKIADMEISFGDLRKAKETIIGKHEEVKKAGIGFIEKIKSMFKSKKKPVLVEDHFMEQKPIVIKELTSEEKEEIPRNILRK